MICTSPLPFAPDQATGSPLPRQEPPSLQDGPLRRYLENPAVRQRMVDFLGNPTLEEAACLYLLPGAPSLEQAFEPAPPSDLWTMVRRGEAARSLWDRRGLIVDLDVEHVHYDRPAEPLRDLERSRRLQAPVAEAIEGLLDAYGIARLHFLSGRGHHWLWLIPQSSRCFFELERLGTLASPLQRRYLEAEEPFGIALGLGLGAAYAGLGKIMEFLGHRILEGAAGRCRIPVELTAATVAPGPQGREAVSIDLSLYGDPLDRRSVRLPFSLYLKGRSLGGPEMLIPVPVAPGLEEEAFEARLDLAAAARLAGRVSTTIPVAAEGTLRLLRDYLPSALAEVHREFYAEEADPESSWPGTYDCTELSSLPPCAARILDCPNDLLLQPAAIQLVVRVLLAAGWRPRHVAGLLRSKYERDYGWIPEVHFHEASCRAEFYVRLFTGLAATRPGDLDDFDCSTTQGRALCPRPSCGWDLGGLRRALGNHEG